MRIVVAVAILSVVFASESEFLFKSEAEQDTPLFKAPNSDESYLLQTLPELTLDTTEQSKPSNFAWWTGFTYNNENLERNARGNWLNPKYVRAGYHGCGFRILHDVRDDSKWAYGPLIDNVGIKEIYLIACNPYAQEKKLYYPLTGIAFTGINWQTESIQELLCSDSHAMTEYNIIYKWFAPDTSEDGLGMTGLKIGCTNGEYHEYVQYINKTKNVGWMSQSKNWHQTKQIGNKTVSSYYVCGAMTKYLSWQECNRDESRVSLLELAICTW